MVVNETLKTITSIIGGLPSCPNCGENLKLKSYVINNIEYHYYKCPKCGTSIMISDQVDRSGHRYIMVLNLSSTLK